MKDLLEILTAKIKESYESGITMDEAEKLASEFLHAQLMIAAELKNLDLNARMNKTALKAIRAAIYMREATKSEKKPSDTFLNELINTDEIAISEQDRLDNAEVELDSLQNYFNVFKEAHIHFRTISKGKFE